MSTLALLLLLVKPVAPAHRGPLDDEAVAKRPAGVLARFESVPKPQAQAAIDAAVTKAGLKRQVTVTFFKTGAGPLAAVALNGERATSFRALLSFAQSLSTSDAVAESYAHLAPAPSDDELEAEGWVRFERGQRVEEQHRAYRDDPVYVKWVRKQASDSTWRLARWPDYPLAELVKRLQLPGRDVLETRRGTIGLWPGAWPTDAGENLSQVTIHLPGGMMMEMLQVSEAEQKSISTVVTAALEQARVSKKLSTPPDPKTAAPYDDEQPGSAQMAQRTVSVWLPEETLCPADDAANAEAASFSRVVQRAWRHAHPLKPASR